MVDMKLLLVFRPEHLCKLTLAIVLGECPKIFPAMGSVTGQRTPQWPVSCPLPPAGPGGGPSHGSHLQRKTASGTARNNCMQWPSLCRQFDIKHLAIPDLSILVESFPDFLNIFHIPSGDF